MINMIHTHLEAVSITTGKFRNINSKVNTMKLCVY